MSLASAPQAHSSWDLTELLTELQTDTWNCGVWVHALIELFISYIDSDDWGRAGDFRTYVETQDDFTPLNLVFGDEHEQARHQNMRFIEGKRDELRDTLLEAAMAGIDPFGDGATAKLPSFARPGSRVLRPDLCLP